MELKNNYNCAVRQYFNIGIIGCGPKGLYAMERLLAQIKSKNIQIPIAIHLFNQNQFFGAGNVYRNDQPPYLIMNYANKNIDIWSRELPMAIVGDTSNFSEWLAEKTGTAIETITNGFASRAMVGNYLIESFNDLYRNAPSNVQIITHITTIENISKHKNQFKLQTNNNNTQFPILFDKLMLTTGHLGSGAEFNIKNPSNRYIEFIYPVSSKLKHIKTDSTVAIQGFGLTSIDAMLSLTEGRGGTFETDYNGQVSYSASGNEPNKIYPFSRTGLPMIPRGYEPEDKSALHYFSEENIITLQRKKYISFQNDLLPLLQQEFSFNYYSVLFKNHDWELKFHSDFEEINKQIAQFHDTFPSEKCFNWELFLNAFQDKNELSHSELEKYINFLIDEAILGWQDSPLISAASTWRKISPVFNKLYSFSGLDAQSHKLFDTVYFGIFNRIAYGPPIKNMKKIAALAKAGIVDFSFVRSPKITKIATNDKTKFDFINHQNIIKIDYFINARVPRNNENKLYSELLISGLARKFQNENQGQYIPNCLDVDFKGRILDSNGVVQEHISVYGTPTEGVTFDNDTLSRKRNNFASQWAHDIVVQLEKEQKNTKQKNEKGIKLF